MQLSRVGIHDSVGVVFPAERLREALSDLAVSVEIVGDDREELAACDGVVTFVHRDAFVGAVDWVHSIQAGYDRFPLEAFETDGVALTNSTGIHGEAVGETVAGMLLAFARRLHVFRDQEAERAWNRLDWDAAFTLAGQRVCVVGLGTLGTGIAERADALGMDVVGVRRSGEPHAVAAPVYPDDQLQEAIADATFVALAVPLTEDTEGLIGAAELAAMPEDAYLVNVARGPVVDEDALVEALQAGTIAGAGLDVFETEPLPEDSPLWEMDDVIVTPHVAAQTRDYYRSIADLVRENVGRIRADEPLYNRVV